MEATSCLQKYSAIKKSRFTHILLNPWAISLSLLAIGLFFTYFQSFRADFSLLPGIQGDARLNHYFLEHSWLWISGNSLHADFWNAPFFYPTKNVMAYSDILLGTAPIYWVFRGLGVSPEISYLIWPGILSILNYITMYIFLRNAFKTDPLPSGAGAFLFSFCAPRLFKLLHIQLWPQFYTPLFMLFLFIFASCFSSNPRRAHFALLGAALCAALQLYAGFYLGWFLIFGFCIFIVVAFIFSDSRNLLLNIFKSQWLWLLLALLFSLVLVLPMALPYMEEQNRVGAWPWNQVKSLLPVIKTFFYTKSFIYEDSIGKTMLYGEHYMGIGFISFAISIYGLIFCSRKNIWCKIFIIMIIVFFLISTLHVFDFYLWKIVYKFFPGGGAIRGVTRIFFLQLIILSVGYAISMQDKRILIQILFICILISENMNWSYMQLNVSTYKKDAMRIAEIAKQENLPFAYIAEHRIPQQNNLDAMWASIYSNRPTINGYSGRVPSSVYFWFSTTPYENIENSAFLKDLKKPYLLIVNRLGSLEKHIIQDELKLSKKPSVDWPTLYMVNFSSPQLPIITSGLSYAESWGRWSDAKEVRFEFPAPLPETFNLQLEANAYGPNVDRDFALLIGEDTYVFTLSGTPEQRVFKINNPLKVRSFVIKVPEPVSPRQWGESTDTRKLGLGIRMMRITSPDTPDGTGDISSAD